MTLAPDSRTRAEFLASKSVRTLKWFFWKALWPATPLVLIYPLYLVVMVARNPFALAFGHGDFLLLALLLLIETALESEHLKHNKLWLEFARQLAIYLALAFTVLFSWMKWDTIVTFPRELASARDWRLELYARLSCCSILIAVGLGLLAYHAACEVEEELMEQRAMAHD